MGRIFMILKIKFTPRGSSVAAWGYIYTPGIYADGYIVFAFPFVCSLVRSFVSSFVIPERSWNLCQSFC